MKGVPSGRCSAASQGVREHTSRNDPAHYGGAVVTWRNWAGDETFRPAVAVRAGSVADVVDAVRGAGERGIRVAGAGHSFGDLVATGGVLVSPDGLTGLLGVDRAAGTARVAAGTRLRELSALLAAQGLALPNLGDIDAQTVAGALATGTHGTGARLPNLAAGVEAMEMVLADGRVVEIDGGEDLAAARIGLGALGVVTALTLRVVPAFTLRARDARAPLTATLDGLDALVDGHDHVDLYAFPHTDVALVRCNDRTGEAARPRSRPAAWLDAVLVQNHLLGAVCRAGRAVPRLIPALNRLVAAGLRPSERVDRSDRVFTSPRRVRFTETEWAVPRAAGADVARAVLAAARRFDVNLPVEVRTVAGDERAFLSPSWGRDTCYVAAHVYRGMAWEGYFRAVQEVALAHDGRPHWGKRHFLDAAALAPRYPAWDRFQAVRAALDPGGVFTNPHVARVLGPVSPVRPGPQRGAAEPVPGEEGGR